MKKEVIKTEKYYETLKQIEALSREEKIREEIKKDIIRILKLDEKTKK